jgi:hypothetical protein
MRLPEQIDTPGFFWQPENPAAKLPGFLRISFEGQVTLELLGVFGDPLEALRQPNTGSKRIIGVIESGEPVTLDECVYTNTTVSFGGMSRSVLRSGIAFIGVAYDADEQPSFSRFRFTAEGFDEWLGISGLRVEHDFDRKTARIDFEPPAEVRLPSIGDLDVAFDFGWSIPFGRKITEAKITQQAYITLATAKPQPIDYFIHAAFKFNNLLSFAVDDTLSITSVTVFSPTIVRNVSGGEVREVPIKAFYRSLPLTETAKKIERSNMLFRYDQVAADFGNMLHNWFRNYEVCEPAFNLYFASRSGAHRFLDGRFLSLTQGIETLHRRTSVHTALPETEFQSLIEVVLEACPEDRRQWLAKKLLYANEPSLKHRLIGLLEPFKNHFGDKKACKSFVRKVVDTRNFLTHYDNRLESQAAKGQQLWVLCQKLEALFQLSLMRMMGLSSNSIDDFMAENGGLQTKIGA